MKNEQKNQKSFYIKSLTIITIACACILSFYYFSSKENINQSLSKKPSKTHLSNKVSMTKETDTEKILQKNKADQRKIHGKNNRTPASIKPFVLQKRTRKIIGAKKFKLINSISSDWKDKAVKKLSHVWHSSHSNSLEIKSIKSAIFVKNGIGKNVEHVLISITNDKGLPASFEAYIDSESGKIVQSWNKTRYEYRDTFSVSPQGREFRGIELKKQL